jgi:gas vesicle protein
MSKTLSGIGLFVAGAGIGAAVALLYAPRSGKHTRARIRNSANRTLNRVEELRDDLNAHLSEWVDETSEVIASSIVSCRQAADAGGERVREALNAVHLRMDKCRERIEEYVRSVAS